MDSFRVVLTDVELSYLGYSGQWYRWERGKLPKNSIRECMDRGVACLKWHNLFPDFRLSYYVHLILDHCPLFLDTDLVVGRHL